MRHGLRLLNILLYVTVAALPARATPFFARAYGYKCETCHSGYPRLNEFGLLFKANSFRVPGAERSAPMAWQRTVPLAAQVKPTIGHENPGGRVTEFTDTQILAGGLLTRTTSFYLHHSYFIDATPQPFPSWEFWAQQVIDDRRKIMVKVGQFELPYSYSMEVNRTTVSTPMLFFGASLAPNDVALGQVMSGIQLSAGSTQRLSLYVDGGAPPHFDSASGFGGQTFFWRIRDVFVRAAYGPPGRQGALFAQLSSPPLTTNSNDSARRLGFDGVYLWRGLQFHGMAVYGENDNPLNNGHGGVLRGAFVEADKMIRPWVGVTGRLDVVTTDTTAGRSYTDGKTLSVRFYPLQHLKLQAEHQWLDHGGHIQWFMAAIAF